MPENTPETAPDAAPDVLHRFLHTADRYPDAVAVIDATGPATYAELAARVRRVAAALGPRPGTVGVLIDRSAGTVAALLGVLAAGGTYCPIDPAFSAERKKELAEAAGCAAVLGTRPDPEPFGPPVIGPEHPDAAAPLKADALPVQPDPDDPAYVLFTSGSTGKPKPVVTPRGAIAAAVESLAALFDVGPGDRVLQFASLNWDTSFEEILPALTRGATLVFDADAYAGSLPRFLRMLDRIGVSVLDLPTAFWHELVHHLTEAGGEALPESVRTVVIGGEATSRARLENWRALPGADRIRLVNTYGCTETTLVTHAAELHGPRARARADGSAPIGRALPHVRELIGEDGELLIGGPALALGYLDLPETTTERFPALAAGRYFRTGDRVRRDDDGALHHEGRLDDQIKVRGIRVDPAEVEAQLCAHPDVASAAATGVRAGDHTTVVAYVTPGRQGDAEGLVSALRAHLREHSPSHLRPNRITVVPELVHTASGKVDRRRTHHRYTTGA
ncbi:amino acid adenylation domain-containing protein [Streptomyces sp. NPDC086554]|uniref:amino acid adenylation domain-containing protein n=1 Tax=Streptomyces sp. NPDC086554 TaxID=3154864 RepID=UPI00343B238C